MSEELEIMREFEKEFKGYMNTRLNGNGIHETSIPPEEILVWLPEAVKREVRRALKKAGELESLTGSENWKAFVAKYSPTPKYCEGMREAIDKGYIGKIKMQSGGWRYSLYVTENKAGVLFLERCPFCEEGNCIGDNK